MVWVKAKWKLRDEDLLQVDGVQFVRLQRHDVDYGLRFALIDKIAANSWSLSTSTGYSNMMATRNRLHEEHMRSERLQAWQRATAKVEAWLHMRNPWSVLTELAEHREVMSIEVPHAGGGSPVQVIMLRPLTFSEGLIVRLDVQNLQHILDYIIVQGFDNDVKPPSRDSQMPRGILEKVLVKRSHGNKRYKMASTYDAALHLLQHDNEASVGDADKREPLEDDGSIEDDDSDTAKGHASADEAENENDDSDREGGSNA